ncbi:PPPDE putative peptidase domain-containing protein [Radiomyces spectabilis]|uniref:PPPDE putative peptidase domain-containing protein n=1 Tax=Radiomyces spectabilis TaxID=64574 RepID=UPI00222076B2|nr:PPPDE putative peptidase domain-containing protein [Radiomyces spectabilis]KAI8394009.1 PPPDE putative peptidase domain-containing protein [Radiomyces spectabilis]
MSGESVKVYLYDLSRGMAKQMSLGLTGKQIDGIWHTSVVVYGQEFFYGQGILACSPGTSHHGAPLEVIDIGETYLPLEVVVEYIDSQRSVYTAEKYHLLDFNCNTFSNDLCQFLTGKKIPGHITDLPAEFMSTPFGRSLLPMIENMFGQSRVAASAASTVGAPSTVPQAPPVSAEMQSMLQGVSSAAMSGAAGQSNSVQTATNLTMLEEWLRTYRAVVVFFTSAGCPPCRMIKPNFEQLLQEKNQDSHRIKILGVIVDTNVAFDAASKYGIRATPTFMLFHNGQKITEFRGANYAELKSSVDLLLFTAYPPHPHRKLHLRGVLDIPSDPVLYANPGKLDVICSKLATFIDDHAIEMTGDQQAVLNKAKQALMNDKALETLDIKAWHDFAGHLLEKLPLDQQFPLLDLFRSLIVKKRVMDYYSKDCSQVVQILRSGYAQGDNIAKASHLMILRLACNLFAHTELVTSQFTSHLPSSHRGELTQLLISALLSPDTQLRVVAGSLAFNCSTVIATDRLNREKNEGDLVGLAAQEDDDWQIEIITAVMDALTKETDEDIVHRFLATIAKFVFLAPTDRSTLGSLLSALDINALLEDKKKTVIKSPRILALVRDLRLLIESSHANES